jgi:hypothetical protein
MNLQEFVKSEEFISAVVSSTKAGFGGSGYSVEFFPDGTHRVLWDNQIGNLYVSAGYIVGIPQLSEEQLSEVDDDNTIEDVAEFYRSELAEMMAD